MAIESNKLIEVHKDTIFQMEDSTRESANEIADLKEALEEKQTTKKAFDILFRNIMGSVQVGWLSKEYLILS
jgi:hypothetical protein